MMSAQSLLLAIIQQLDADLAISTLVNAGLRVTHIGSTGGFPTGTFSLQTGNVTLLMELDKPKSNAPSIPKGLSVWTT